ncbi:TetR family transcriptional regulator [Granulosicoccaceae sp. 1_MG-2023]|nr:TetR family transcriptional regulator [Granulosicoccaceae sp. 1_MG-2023]
MVRKTKEESERTHQSLIDAAIELFHEQGANSTTLHDIAARVGMTRGAVYWHFQNKDDIIVAIWKRDGAAIQQAFQSDMRVWDYPDPLAQFRYGVMRLVERLALDPHLYKVTRVVFNALEKTDHPAELQRYLMKEGAVFYNAILEAISYLRREGLLHHQTEDRLLAFGLCGYMHGLVHLAATRSSRGEADRNEDYESVLNIYLDAVLK